MDNIRPPLFDIMQSKGLTQARNCIKQGIFLLSTFKRISR